jgi:methionyl-tRNA formyltransferase
LHAPPTDGNELSIAVLNPFVAETTLHAAWAHEIPVFSVRGLGSNAVREAVADLDADVACVACFPWRIPPKLLVLPRHGFLNTHPSLLPAHRGPTPLFWIFRAGAQASAGVTIHWMDADFDTGDVAAQARVDLPDGISGAQADARCAAVGGELLVDVLRALEKGAATRRPQSPGGSYEPWPQSADFALDLAWSARRAFNFMRGTAEWDSPYTVWVGGQEFQLRWAISFDEAARVEGGWQREHDVVRIQFTPGVLTAHLL